MSLQRDCSEDWIARAKRGVLTDSQERELRDLLATSAEARLLYEAGSALDRDACVVAGDDALLERIAGQLHRRYEKRTQPLRLRGKARGIAAVLLVAGVAVGAVGISKKVEAPAPVAAPMHTATKRIAALTARASNEPTDTEAPSATSVSLEHASARRLHESADTGVIHSAPVSASVPGATATVALPSLDKVALPLDKSATGRFEDVVESRAAALQPPAETSAATLFAEANRARVRGDAASAIRDYEQLLSRYPQSRESVAARISLGMLYLQQGQPEPALQQFRGYVTTGGPLTAEALWGQARALHLLGRLPEERATLERIVREFPGSPYAATAQTRLTHD